jgi:hypothetical protein
MMLSSAAPGFCSHGKRVASSRLIDAVAAALAVSAFSLGVAVAVTLLSIRIGVARPRCPWLRCVAAINDQCGKHECRAISSYAP